MLKLPGKMLLGLLVICLVAGAAVLATSTQATTTQTEGRSYSFNVQINPQPDTANQYTCTAVLKDVNTNEVLFAPKAGTTAGISSSVESESLPGQPTYSFSFSVSKDGKLAQYEMTVRNGAKVSMNNKASVQLK